MSVYLGSTYMYVRKGKCLAKKHSGKVKKALTKMRQHQFGTTTFLRLVQCSTLGQETKIQVHREATELAFSMQTHG